MKAECDNLSNDVWKVYGQGLIVSEEQPVKKISKLVVADKSIDFHQKQLLYKKVRMSICESVIAEIIETNQ